MALALTCSIVLRWIVDSSILLWSKGLEMSTALSTLLAPRTVAMAITLSVSRSVEAKPSLAMERLTCNMAATCSPPTWPSVLPSRTIVCSDLLNWERKRKY